MSLCQTTPVPNGLFDQHLATLKEVELKVLLVIIRKTLGWVEVKNPRQRKQLERISIVCFEMNTGCSRRGISNAIQTLVERKLIYVFDQSGNKLDNPEERKGKFTLYFQPVIKTGENSNNLRQNLPIHRANYALHPGQNLLNTIKERNTKKGKETIFPLEREQYSANQYHITNHLTSYKSYGTQK